MTSDWNAFIDGLPWLLDDGTTVEVGDPHPWARPLPVAFPQLQSLLTAARVTPVTIGGEPHELLSWAGRTPGDRRHWLCRPPGRSGIVHPQHADLLQQFGGIVERGVNEPVTWLLNTNDSLTARESAHDATFITGYHGIDDRCGIDVTAYYAISREWNGNTTFCHRRDGDVVLFAPDHDFSHVEVLDGCPPYTLYRLHGAPTFAAWVEEIARQWLAVTAPS
jgi:hypothetical protein